MMCVAPRFFARVEGRVRQVRAPPRGSESSVAALVDDKSWGQVAVFLLIRPSVRHARQRRGHRARGTVTARRGTAQVATNGAASRRLMAGVSMVPWHR